MPQFDLANANVSSSGFTNIKNRIGFVPFVYDTGYPNLGNYIDNDPVPSGSDIFSESIGGRVPFDPDFHNGVRGNLVVGYGHTYRNEGAQWRGSDALFYDFYSIKENAGDSNSTSFTINSVDYAFPIQKGDVFATTDDGGKFLDASNNVITKGIRIKYIGDDTANTNQRFSESIASTLLSEDLIGYKNKVIAVFNGSEDAYANLATLYENEFRDVLAEMEVAANNGNAMAQFNLGWINARGLMSSEGLMQDMDIAKAWFEKSANLGFKDAIEVLEKNF